LKTGRSEGGHGSSTKSWSEYSQKHHYAKRKALRSNIQAALSFCEGECYQAISIQLENIETHSRDILNVQDGTFSEVKKDSTATDEDRVRFALYVKDKFSLSDEAYHVISLLAKMSLIYTRSKSSQKISMKGLISSLAYNRVQGHV